MGAAWSAAEDLATIIQRESVDRSTADLLLQAAADAVRAECSQDIDVAVTTEILDGPPPTTHYYEVPPADSIVHVTQRPIIAVTSITEDIGFGPVSLVADQDFTYSASGSTGIYRIVGGLQGAYIPWTVNKRGIVVTYNHGWAVTHRNFSIAKQVALQAAARAYVNPEGKHQEGFGVYSVRYYGSATPVTGLIQFTPYEKEMLAPLHSTSLST